MEGHSGTRAASLESDSVLSGSFRDSAVAEAFAKEGKVDKAAPLLARAFTFLKQNDERYVEAELERIAGEIELHRARLGADDAESSWNAAEDAFRRAMATGAASGAKSLRLRAAMSLARLLASQRRKAEAVRILHGEYEDFSEGFETPDLIRARALLDQLS